MPKRIAVDVRSLAAPHSGIGRYTQRLLERLIDLMKVDEVEWFFYSDRPVSLSFISLDRVTIRSFSYHNKVLSIIRSQIVFSQWARMDAVDLYWSPRHHLPLLLNSRVRSVVTIHDMVWKTFPETMQVENRILERMLMPPSLNRADKIIAVSRATASEISDTYPELVKKTVVIHEAADSYSDVSPPAYSFEYFLFVGTQEPRKNLVNILAAIEKCVCTLSQHFVFVGGPGWCQWHSKFDPLWACIGTLKLTPLFFTPLMLS